MAHEHPHDGAHGDEPRGHDQQHDHDADHDQDQGHGHGHDHAPGLRGWFAGILRPHSHDSLHATDAALDTSGEGIRAVQVSLVALGVTALLQLGIVWLTGSVALLADTIHNFGDASTAIPLWIAFSLGRRAASRRYTYGYRRAEDLAGLFVVLMIAASAALAGWESFARLMAPRLVEHPQWVLLAGLLGALGNEFVARYRMRVGRRIHSEALVADGLHARTDALTSLAVAVGAIALIAGYPRADAIVGLAISALILVILKDTALAITRRMMDAVDPQTVEQAESVLRSVDGVRGVGLLRMRWVGHRLHVEAEIEVDPQLDVASAHAIADRSQHVLVHEVAAVEDVVVHVHPAGVTELHHATEHHHSALV